jgi:hypothetical protein
MRKLIKQVEIWECSDYDRYIYVEYTNGQITELNYHQGICEDFDPYYAKNDPDLLNFYTAVEDILHHFEEDQVDRFNLAIDMHFAYKNPY